MSLNIINNYAQNLIYYLSLYIIYHESIFVAFLPSLHFELFSYFIGFVLDRDKALLKQNAHYEALARVKIDISPEALILDLTNVKNDPTLILIFNLTEVIFLL
jgi:hypothetical protein